jgi:hypothetical protein
MTARSCVALTAAAGLLLYVAAPAHGQSRPVPGEDDGRPGHPAGNPHFDCSRAPNPVNCEARRKEFRAQLINAQNACETVRGEAHHACMIQTMCRQERNPAQCEEFARRRADFRREVREACAGRTGDDLRNCLVARLGYAPWRQPASDGDE